MTRFSQIAFSLVAIGVISHSSAVRADNRSQVDSPWQSSQRLKTSETDAGRASFTNDCPLDQTMYVKIDKAFGPVEFIVAPHKTVARSVDRGDKFAARCGIVVAERAAYDWIKLDQR